MFIGRAYCSLGTIDPGAAHVVATEDTAGFLSCYGLSVTLPNNGGTVLA